MEKLCKHPFSEQTEPIQSPDFRNKSRVYIHRFEFCRPMCDLWTFWDFLFLQDFRLIRDGESPFVELAIFYCPGEYQDPCWIFLKTQHSLLLQFRHNGGAIHFFRPIWFLHQLEQTKVIQFLSTDLLWSEPQFLLKRFEEILFTFAACLYHKCFHTVVFLLQNNSISSIPMYPQLQFLDSQHCLE